MIQILYYIQILMTARTSEYFNKNIILIFLSILSFREIYHSNCKQNQ